MPESNIKKVFISLLSSVLLVVPVCALAQPTLPDYCQIRVDPTTVGVNCSGTFFNSSTGRCTYSTTGGGICGVCCTISTILYITNWIFIFLIAVVLFFVLIGGYNILTSAGDASKVKSGRDYILYAAIGLAIALMSRALPALVRYIVAP